MDSNKGPRPKLDRVARPGQGPVPPVLVWPLGLVSLTSSPPAASRGKILTLEKFLVNLCPRRSLKRKNMQNKVFLFYRVITKINLHKIL
jgi:hypothetical protein